MSSAPPTNRARWSWTCWLGIGYCLGLVLFTAGYCGWLVWTQNLHAVIPGRVYRSGQVDLPLLEDLVRRLGIRTVINLRGSNPEHGWYQEECTATHQLNLSQQDIHLSAYRLPPASELRRLVQVLDHSEYPLLIHCKHGADRTGLISALILLLYTDATLAEAERQLGPAFGRVSIGPTANLDDFYALYREWLTARGRAHCRLAFREWLEHGYCAAGLLAELEWLDSSTTVPVGRPFAVRVQARNASGQAWRFRAGETAGCHVLFFLVNDRGQLVHYGRAGQFEAEVAPGGSIEVTIPVNALLAAGTYHLLVDLEDGRRGTFYQFGSRPILRALQAVE